MKIDQPFGFWRTCPWDAVRVGPPETAKPPRLSWRRWRRPHRRHGTTDTPPVTASFFGAKSVGCRAFFEHFVTDGGKIPDFVAEPASFFFLVLFEVEDVSAMPEADQMGGAAELHICQRLCTSSSCMVNTPKITEVSGFGALRFLVLQYLEL